MLSVSFDLYGFCSTSYVSMSRYVVHVFIMRAHAVHAVTIFTGYNVRARTMGKDRQHYYACVCARAHTERG